MHHRMNPQADQDASGRISKPGLVLLAALALSSCGSDGNRAGTGSGGTGSGLTGSGLTGSATSDDIGIGRQDDQPVNVRGSLGADYRDPDPLAR